MTKRSRRNHPGSLEAKAAIAALRGAKTLSEIAGQYQVHPTQVTGWKRQLLDRAADVFGGTASRKDSEPGLKLLHARIGRQALENAFLGSALTKAGMLGAEK